jgi:hypothetical protein
VPFFRPFSMRGWAGLPIMGFGFSSLLIFPSLGLN